MRICALAQIELNARKKKAPIRNKDGAKLETCCGSDGGQSVSAQFSKRARSGALARSRGGGEITCLPARRPRFVFWAVRSAFLASASHRTMCLASASSIQHIGVLCDMGPSVKIGQFRCMTGSVASHSLFPVWRVSQLLGIF